MGAGRGLVWGGGEAEVEPEVVEEELEVEVEVVVDELLDVEEVLELVVLLLEEEVEALVLLDVDEQDAVSEVTVPWTGSLTFDSGVPGGRSTSKVSRWPLANVTVIRQGSADAAVNPTVHWQTTSIPVSARSAIPLLLTNKSLTAWILI